MWISIDPDARGPKRPETADPATTPTLQSPKGTMTSAPKQRHWTARCIITPWLYRILRLPQITSEDGLWLA